MRLSSLRQQLKAICFKIVAAAFKNPIMKAISNEVMSQITRSIVAELNPEEIILFGSHAWGTPHKYSDIDLCVIVPDGIPGFDRIEWGVRALNALNDLPIDVDVMVTTRSVIDTFKTVPASLQRKIVEEGKVLYAKCKNSPGEVLVEKSAT